MKQLVLGTAQLGLQYGMNKKKNKIISEKEAIDILEFAYANDILSYDTARTYGTSEFLLGKFLKNKKDVEITTKLDTNIISDTSKKTVDNIIASIDKSHILIGKINTILLHRMDQYYHNDMIIIKTLNNMKTRGYFEKIGVSIYNVDQAIDLLSDKMIDHIQLPINFLDSQWKHKTFLDLIKKSNITIYARSIFLQGILVSDASYWPKIPGINPVEYIYKIDQLVESFGLGSRIELCFSYVNSIPWIDGIIIGVDSILHIKENLKHIKTRCLTVDEINQIAETFGDVPKILINPSMWNKTTTTARL
jgi:aryl-alcohol dehydrogenase-like predicted oxidoreductase